MGIHNKKEIWGKELDTTKIVSNDHRIAGMLMFISLATIVDEWIELGSLASSLKNDAVNDKRVESIAKPIMVFNPI